MNSCPARHAMANESLRLKVTNKKSVIMFPEQPRQTCAPCYMSLQSKVEHRFEKITNMKSVMMRCHDATSHNDNALRARPLKFLKTPDEEGVSRMQL